MENFRPPAIPLITHDPLFSIWSFADNLTDDTTRHWDGVRQFMFGFLTIDGIIYEFLGKVMAIDERYASRYRVLPQKSCVIRPMTTEYFFENELVTLKLRFTSPLLLNNPKILARPLSYIDYEIRVKDSFSHDIHVQFGFSGEFCVNRLWQTVSVGTTAYSIYFTSGKEDMLVRCGDDHRIEWGSFHVIAPDYIMEAMSLRSFWVKLTERYASRSVPINIIPCQGPDRETAGADHYDPLARICVADEYPTILVRKEFHNAIDGISDGIAIAFDDIKSIQFMGENLDPYWKKYSASFEQMVMQALSEREEILSEVKSFEDNLLNSAEMISPKYADIISLAYRQVVAAHKLVKYQDKFLFVSKENYSNGCAATVDVTYPSMPLFLIYAPELVEGMMEPIYEMIYRGYWSYEFAPHDAGKYPLLNGQMYGYTFRARSRRPNPRDSQMPVEECGNMIICTAAVCLAKHDISYFKQHQGLIRQWADYLVISGWDPEDQLCTDDFSGHLAHNCNLSVKLICALKAYSLLLAANNDFEQSEKYSKIASEFAEQWEHYADNTECTKLTFDAPGTWSLKYNMVWDRLFSMNLFSDKLYKKELSWYKTQINAYGIPLDSRCECTKTDWEMWSTALFDDKEYTDTVVNAMWRWLVETPERMPFPDLVFTTKPWLRGFIARSVQGGLFINLLRPENLFLPSSAADKT